MKKKLMPFVAQAVSHPLVRSLKRDFNAFKGVLQSMPPVIEVFLRIDDPYSWLLVRVLPQLRDRLGIPLRFHAVEHLQKIMYPDLSAWHQNAFVDAGYLAQLYGLTYPQECPERTAARISLYSEALAEAVAMADQHPGDETILDQLSMLFTRFWLEADLPAPELSRLSHDDALLRLRVDEGQLQRQGHYLSATLFYRGEWYWGLDRLYFLEQRVNSSSHEGTLFDRQHFDCSDTLALSDSVLSEAAGENTAEPVVMYFSLRSPYSYLGLEKAVRLARRYQRRLLIKPVLPMVMRGLSVPPVKKMYIFLDTKREAERAGIPYGRVADPLGAGVERCYALFDYAVSQGLGVAYLLSCARGVNAEGLHADSDRDLAIMVRRAGLNWERARTHLSNTDWRLWAEQNMQTLSGLGLWGVPCFYYRDRVVWGQDRVWVIEQMLRTEPHPRAE